MIVKEDILPYGRYKYALPVTGSFKGMRYKIEHPKPKEDEENLIYVDIWPGPFCYEKTNEEDKIKNSFPYCEESYEEVLKYLNEMYEQNPEKWVE